MAWIRRRGRAGSFLARWFRRLRRLAVVGGVGGAAYAWWQGRSAGSSAGSSGGGGPDGGGRRAPTGGPRSPSALRASAEPQRESELVSAVAGDAATGAGTTTTAGARAWIEPLEGGACPGTHPIKANDNSGIYHVPGGRFYDRTAAERCYLSTDAAEADGYRRAKQ